MNICSQCEKKAEKLIESGNHGSICPRCHEIKRAAINNTIPKHLENEDVINLREIEDFKRGGWKTYAKVEIPKVEIIKGDRKTYMGIIVNGKSYSPKEEKPQN